MSEMTIIPDLYLEGDSKQWKNWQAIYLEKRFVKGAFCKKSIIYKQDIFFNAITPCIAKAVGIYPPLKTLL